MSESEMTLKNTKAEILEALQNAQKRAEMAEKGRLSPEKTEKMQMEKQAVESAKKSVEQSIFSKELIDKFNALQVAITAEENRLNELYGVGRELQKLALVIESGKDSLERFKVESLKNTEEANNNLKQLELEYNQKRSSLKAEYEQAEKKLMVDRAREAEEYQYKLARAREKDNNAWLDEKNTREASLSKLEERAAELLSEAEGKAAYVASLESKVEGISSLLEREKQIAVNAAIADLKREHEYASALSEKDYKSTIARLEDKIIFLEKELLAANKTASILHEKLDKAYTELRELATKTVESASGVRIIGSSENKL